MNTRFGWHGRLAVGLGVAASLAAAGAPAAFAAPAHTVRLTGGTTTLAIAPSAYKALGAVGVQVGIVKPAKMKGNNIVLPVGGGSIDPANAKGTIALKGGYTLTKGPIQVRLAPIVLDTRKHTLTASVHGAKVILATLSDGKVKRSGFATTVTGVKVKATRLGAIALDTTFGTRAFRTGSPLATATIAPTSKQVVLQRGAAKLVLGQNVLGALAQARASVTAIAPGTLDAATGTVTLPVSGGALTSVKPLAGTITYKGGFSVASIPLNDYVARLGATSTLTAMGLPLATLKFGANAVALHPATRTVSVNNAAVLLTQEAAGAFDGALFGGMPVLAPGAQIGTAQLSAVAR